MTFVTIFTSFSQIDAQMARGRLEAAGFHPFIKDELSALTTEGYTLAAGGVRVQVPEAEAADAKEFLNSPDQSAE